jgi:hypothetical protein
MNALAIGTRCDPARVTENIDMSTPQRKVGISFRAIRPLVFTIGLLAGLPGTAWAQTGFCEGTIDFCDVEDGHPKWYDNAQPPGYGCFTDLLHSGWRPPNPATVTFRPPEINVYQNMRSTTNPSGTNPWGDSVVKPQTCGLNFYGDSLLTSNNHAEMWLTIVQPPGQTPPMLNQWGLTATIWYDNVGGAPNPHGSGGWNNGKFVGIVTNFNPANKTGLFLGLYDAGNTEFLQLLQFDASPNPPNNMMNPTVVASKSLIPNSIHSTGDGGSTFFSFAYVVTLDISTVADASQATGNRIDAYASVFPADTPYNQSPGNYSCPNNHAPDQQCLVYHGALPAGIIAAGAVGLATLAPTSGSGVIDTYVSKFTVKPGQDSD